MRPNAYSEVESPLKTAQNTPHGCVGIVQSRPKQERLVPFPDFHPRAVGGLFKLNPHNRQVRPFPKIHPRQWGGWFKLNLRTESRGLLPESHPRQWVDGSSSTYERRAAHLSSLSPRGRVDGLAASKVKLERSAHRRGRD